MAPYSDSPGGTIAELTDVCDCAGPEMQYRQESHGHLPSCVIGRVFRDGARYPVKPGAFTVQPGKVRALSKEGKAWFRATLANVRESNARIARRSTILSLAELSPTIAAREARLKAWSTGGRKAAGPVAPWNPEGPTAACPDYGRDRWVYFTTTDGKGSKSVARRVIGCGCILTGIDPHNCPDTAPCAPQVAIPAPRTARPLLRDLIIARAARSMARVRIAGVWQ